MHLARKNSPQNPAINLHTKRRITECQSLDEEEARLLKKNQSKKSIVRTERKSYNTTPQNS